MKIRWRTALCKGRPRCRQLKWEPDSQGAFMEASWATSHSQYHTQQTFQRRFNVVFRLIWRRNVPQRQINVETSFCTSKLEISTFTGTTSDNVETTLSFSTSICITLGNIETTLWIWPYEKNKPQGKYKIKFLSFKEKLFELDTLHLEFSSLYSPFLQEYAEEH